MQQWNLYTLLTNNHLRWLCARYRDGVINLTTQLYVVLCLNECTCVSYILCCYMITCSVENNGDHEEVQEASHLCHQLIKSSRSLASTKIPHILSLHRHFLVGAQRVP